MINTSNIDIYYNLVCWLISDKLYEITCIFRTILALVGTAILSDGDVLNGWIMVKIKVGSKFRGSISELIAM